jgi:hypothetical protein
MSIAAMETGAMRVTSVSPTGDRHSSPAWSPAACGRLLADSVALRANAGWEVVERAKTRTF